MPIVGRKPHALLDFKSRSMFSIGRAGRLLERIGRSFKRRGWGGNWIGGHVIDALLLPSDIATLRDTYAAVFGPTPRLLKPRTFNEKLQSSKIFNRKRRYIHFADKIAVREFVRDRIGSDVLTEIFWIGVDLEDARRELLPSKFVIKTNHMSNANLIVEDASLLDWEATRARFRRWLCEDFSSHYGEWQYRWIQPKLFIEEYLYGKNGSLPIDYKFFCFHGRVEMVQVDLDRFSNHTRALFDRDFNPLPVRLVYPRYQGSLSPPFCYREMRDIAERLAIGEPFLRVDLYDVGGPIFGELTMHPEAGHGQFEPPEWDARLGALWRG